MMRPIQLAPLLLLACGPVSVQQAERECFNRARLAEQPRGEIGIGIGSDGTARGVFDVTVSADYLSGKDPSVVYETCVLSKSGQPPTRPLYDRPDWKG
jgi:hypothetical protein